MNHWKKLVLACITTYSSVASAIVVQCDFQYGTPGEQAIGTGTMPMQILDKREDSADTTKIERLRLGTLNAAVIYDGMLKVIINKGERIIASNEVPDIAKRHYNAPNSTKGLLGDNYVLAPDESTYVTYQCFERTATRK